MKGLNLGRYALTSCVAAAMLAGCGGSQPPIAAPGAIPQSRAVASRAASRSLHEVAGPNSSERGIYVVVWDSSFFALLGYRIKSGHIKTPPCTVKGVSFADSVTVDGQGNLIVPEPNTSSVGVFEGPTMCGPDLGSVYDPYGSPIVVASNNAVTGNIAVAHASGGIISICKLATLDCNAKLTNPDMSAIAGIAMANNGDCWASAYTTSYGVALFYFRHCSGTGKAATGYQNTNAGGLYIDSEGNLVSMDFGGSGPSSVYVYKGCKPRCSLLGGPFFLDGNQIQGSLNKESTTFATVGADTRSQVNIYSYSPTKINYLYSFDTYRQGDGLGVAYNPRSKQ
jgi:hypothetical protein